VFIVAGPDPESTEAILAIAEGCTGHPAARRTAGQDVAGAVGGGVANPLGAKRDGGWRGDLDNDTYIPEIIANTIDANIGTKQWLGDQNVTDFLPVMDAIAIRTAQTSANGHGIAEDVAHTIDGANGQAVAHTLSADGFDASEDGTGRGTPLCVQEAQTSLVRLDAAVRRLTPVECARLQAFPDDWLDGADGPQSRALGNAVTVSVIEWIGRRMMAVLL
jgi:DNA (cytosine-5)-methyltransferase 1